MSRTQADLGLWCALTSAPAEGMLSLLQLLACGTARSVSLPEPEAPELAPTVILVSLDGFRWDYLERAETPTLDRLAAEGIRAEALVPGFPSKTFPSHYTIATGLYPEHHGIVDNTFYDPERDAWFSMSDSGTVRDGSWWGGEPIWVTAGRQGLRSGTCFWPGSEAEIAGGRPTYVRAYDGGLPWADRVAQILDWLDLPADERPQLLTLYFEEPDHSGHSYGPDGPEVEAAAAEVDAGLALLIEGLEARQILDSVELLIVSDHGMAATGPERLVFLDDAIDTRELTITSWGTFASIWPDEADVGAVAEALSGVDGARCAAREDLPPELHFSEGPRVAPVICVADVGWSITTRDWATSYPDYYDGGTHGYDPAAAEMQGVLIGRGPQLAQGLISPPIDSVDLYPLMARLLGVEPAESDGELARAEHLLRAP